MGAASRKSGLTTSTCLLMGLIAAVSEAPAATQVILRHDITPGTLTTFNVRIETTRHRVGQAAADRPESIETGTLTRMMFRARQEGRATCAQMLELRTVPPGTAPPARAATAPASAPADAAAPKSPALDLPAALAAESAPRVQFVIGSADLQLAPFIVPGTTAWEREATSTVFNVTAWPPDHVEVGGAWEREFTADKATGTRSYRVEKIEAVGQDTRVTLTTRTTLDPPPENSHRQVVSAASIVVWSATDRELVTLEGRLVYREFTRTGGRETVMKIDLAREAQRRLPTSQQAIERKAIIHLSKALSAYQRQDPETAVPQLKQFLRRWPRSQWRPMVEYVLAQVEGEQGAAEPLAMDDLKRTLVGLLARWNEGEADDDFALLARCRPALAHLTKINRPEIVRLLDDADANYRALACFALGFGTVPADVALIQKRCQDSVTTVRRTALYALAMRASPLADAAALIEHLDDDDATVRQRACEAVGICVTPGSSQLDKARAALVTRLDDVSDAVVLAAARALARIGSPAEIDRIRQLADRTDRGPVRDALLEILTLATSPDAPEASKPPPGR